MTFSIVLEYLASERWSDIENPTWWLDGWEGSDHRMVLSVPMLPQEEPGGLADGARGAFDVHFAHLADNLVDRGLGSAMIRPGWEFNGGWSRWSAADDPAAYAAFFRRIHDVMEARPDTNFEWVWSPTLGAADFPAERAYPGDVYVDFVGLSVYDQAWGPNSTTVDSDQERWKRYIVELDHGLDFWRSFVRDRDISLAITEWGVIDRSDGHGGGDDPYYVQQMYDFIMDTRNEVAFHIYFDFDAPDGGHELSGQTAFPESARLFRQLFGG